MDNFIKEYCGDFENSFFEVKANRKYKLFILNPLDSSNKINVFCKI